MQFSILFIALACYATGGFYATGQSESPDYNFSNTNRKIFTKGELCKVSESAYQSCLKRQNVLIIVQDSIYPTKRVIKIRFESFLGLITVLCLQESDKRVYLVIEALVGLNQEVTVVGYGKSKVRQSKEDEALIDSLDIQYIPQNLQYTQDVRGRYRYCYHSTT